MSGVCTNLRLKVMERMTEDASPGPAAHVGNVDAVKSLPPRVLIGRASRSPRDTHTGVPGPSEYQDLQRLSTVSGRHIEDSRLQGVPGVRIGTSKRGGSPLIGEGSPGPGQYSITGSTSSPRNPTVVFGRDQRDAHSGMSSPVPGPGAYSVQGEVMTTAPPRQPFSHAPRFSSNLGEEGCTPGPGAYGSLQPTGLPQSPRALIGTSTRPSLSSSSFTPGPSYSPNLDFVRPSSPRSPFSRAERGSAQQATLSLGAAVSSPGPGAYPYEAHDSTLRHSSPRQSIGTAQRFRGANDEGGVPGPGSYSLGGSKTLGGSMSRAGRNATESVLDNPGVAYATTAASTFTRPRSAATVIGTSPRFGVGGKGGGTPAPGAYNVELGGVLPSSSRIATMGRSSRDGLYMSSSKDGSPGPGSYAVERLDGVGSISHVGGKANTPRVSIGKSGRGGPETLSTPGPAYSPRIEYVRPSTSKFSMPRGPRGDLQSSPSHNSPGPQDYAPSISDSTVLPHSPTVKIGSAQRFGGSFDPSALPPGPGSYSVEESLHITGGAMPRSPRNALSTGQGGPGPGDYVLPVTNVTGPGSMPRDPRFHSLNSDSFPGPGSHNVSTNFTQPQPVRTVIGHASRDPTHGATAGSDAPLYLPGLAAVKASSPRQPIGSAPRFSPSPDSSSETPGPGAFSTPKFPSGPSFTIRGER